MAERESAPVARGRTYVPAVGPRLKKLLVVLLAAFAVLSVNSVYLVSVTIFEWSRQQTYQNYFYQYMFLFHLVLGLAIVVPLILFGIFHIRNAYTRPNRRAVRAGLALFATSLILLLTGIILTRLDFFVVKDPTIRGVSYWIHVLSPLVVVWLFILHRLAGPGSSGRSAPRGRAWPAFSPWSWWCCTRMIRGNGTWWAPPRASSISSRRWPAPRPATSSRPGPS